MRNIIFDNNFEFTNVAHSRQIFDNTCRLSNLEELNLYKIDESIDELLLNLNLLPKLKKLTIWGYNYLTDDGIRNIPNTIETLCLIFCFNITQTSLSHFTNLSKLNIRYCPNIQESIIFNSLNLREISFFTNDYISDIFFVSISNLVNLEKLTLNYCFSVTNEGLRLINKFPKLRKLYITDVLNLNIEETEIIIRSCNINIIFISSLFWKLYKIKNDDKITIEYDFQYIIDELNQLNELEDT